MSPVDVALRNRSTVFFSMAAMVLLGLIAYVTLPREKFPDIQIPLIIVYVAYPGAAPNEVETQITTPVERELAGLEGVKKLSSVSEEGLSLVTIEFLPGTDIDSALQKVRDRVDRADTDFPDDAEDPFLQEISMSDFPILQINLFGDVGPVMLKKIAEDLQDEIEAVPGVLRANLVGGREREVRVDVDPEKLRLHALSLDDVVDAVRDENVSIPGGDMDLGDVTYAVRVPGEVEDPVRVADFVIKSRDGRPVFLRDVAAVSFGFKDRTSFARINGQESVGLAVQKRVGANIIGVIDEIKVRVAAAEKSWPMGVQATVLGDLSRDIRIQVRDLENSILSGLFLVVGVLMFALGLRNSFFVGLAIPFSMLLTFAVFRIIDVALNNVVLFGMVLAVGMLVDNAVVVIENIYRHVQEGAGRLEAASLATREVAGAIAVSTFTTLAAFAPLFRWPGLIGDFMRYLPLTVSIALGASLIVAFTINPVMCAALMRSDPRSAAGGRDSWLARMGSRIVESYRRLLLWSLDHRATVVGGTVLTFVVVAASFVLWNPGIELLPESEPIQVFVDLDMPPGTRVEKTDRLARELEGRVQNLTDVEVLASGVGEGSQSDGLGGGANPDRARLSLDLLDYEHRTRNGFATLAEVREVTAGIPGAVVDVDKPDDLPVGDPVSIQIRGDDFAVLGDIAARVREEIADIPGLVSLDDDFDLARPEIVVTVDRTEAARLGLTTANIAGTIRTAVNGNDASTYRRGDEDIDITVRLREDARSSIDDLRRLVVVNDDGKQVPLDAVAVLERSAALTSIRHEARRRTVTVSGQVTEPRLAEPVRTEARRRIRSDPDLLPPGYSLSFGGQSELEDESKEFLSEAFLYAIVLVLVLMVGKFDSVMIPLIIITSVAMSMIGVLLGLLVTGFPFGIIMTGVGVISLAGIVVNNAIVLLDYAEQQRVKGLPRREVVVVTGERRLRPVLLTAITTILGLLPLTTGVEFDFHTLTFSTGSESSQYWRTMGVSVIFGLAFATFLTLVLVPVLYDGLLAFWERREARGTRVTAPDRS